MERYLNVTEARRELLGLIEQLDAGDKVVITKRGRPRAVLVDAERYALLEDVAWLMSDPGRRGAMEQARREMDAGELVAPPAGRPPSQATLRQLASQRQSKRR